MLAPSNGVEIGRPLHILHLILKTFNSIRDVFIYFSVTSIYILLYYVGKNKLGNAEGERYLHIFQPKKWIPKLGFVLQRLDI